MCFETTKSAKAKIAKTDIECWKILYSELNGKKYESLCEYFHYHPGRATKRVIIKKEITEINEGYYSFKTRITAEDDWMMGHSKKIYKMIIPAGTRYFENNTEYVSETIILV